MTIIRKILLKRVNNRIKKTAFCIGKRFINNSLSSRVTKNTVIGDDVSFNGMIVIGNGRVTIGDHFHCAEGCYIISDNHDYDHGQQLPYDEKNSIPKDVVIEDNVWFGVGVIVLPGACIREGAIIQAGSVVCGEIEYCSIVGGHPAKLIKYRDIQHYEELKQKKAFIKL